MLTLTLARCSLAMLLLMPEWLSPFGWCLYSMIGRVEVDPLETRCSSLLSSSGRLTNFQIPRTKGYRQSCTPKLLANVRVRAGFAVLSLLGAFASLSVLKLIGLTSSTAPGTGPDSLWWWWWSLLLSPCSVTRSSFCGPGGVWLLATAVYL